MKTMVQDISRKAIYRVFDKRALSWHLIIIKYTYIRYVVISVDLTVTCYSKYFIYEGNVSNKAAQSAVWPSNRQNISNYKYIQYSTL